MKNGDLGGQLIAYTVIFFGIILIVIFFEFVI